MIHLLLNTAKCAYPLTTDPMLSILRYTEPAMEGLTILLDCSPGLVLTGPDSSTCVRNGQWEPDPSLVKCKGLIVCAQNTDLLTQYYFNRELWCASTQLSYQVTL